MNDITTTSTANPDTVAKNWYKIVVDYAEGNHNNSMDITKPHLRSTFANSFEFVIFMYLIICVFGAGANFAEIYFILKYKLYRDTTYVYLINLSIADIIKCMFVLPFSVTTLLLENWLFGGFLCYFLPMLQVRKKWKWFWPRLSYILQEARFEWKRSIFVSELNENLLDERKKPDDSQ